jgi:Legionella pneumophila major outer membrane protein precursor
MKTLKISKLSAAIASAAAASQADGALAQTAAPAPGTTTITVEGGIPFSNFSNSAFPAGAVPFIPQSFGKIGSTPVSSGNLDPGQRWGGYGSFSVARNYDAVNDWRFSAGLYVFGTGDRSASASQQFTGPGFFAINTADVTERDRFALATGDFDFGRNWSDGIFKVRAFAGVRTLYSNDQFDAAFHTVGTDKTGLFNSTTVTDSMSRGRSSFFGAGPRVGVDVFAGSTFGIVGNVSAALLAGVRQSSYWTLTTVAVNGGAPFSGSTYISSDGSSWVGNLSGSLGAAWQFSPNGQLVIGYKLDKWYNVRESFSFAGFNKKEDVLIQSPFIKASMRF